MAGGYSNPVTGLGMPGTDSRLASTFAAGYITDEQAAEMWRGDAIAQKIVSMLPKEALEPGVALTVQDERRTVGGQVDTRAAGDLVEDVERMHRDLGTEAIIKRACEWERLFGGAAIWAGANDYQAGSWAAPLNLEAPMMSVRWLDVLRSRDLTPVSIYTDPLHPKYGKVEVWRLSRVIGSGRLHQYAEIHESRLFLFRGSRIVDDGTVITQNMQSTEFGDGIMIAVQGALRRFQEALDNTEHAMRANGELLWQHNRLSEILANEGEDDFRKLVAAMSYASSILRARVVGSDQTLTRQSISLAGLADVVTKFENELAALSGIPRTKLFGEAPGGLGNNAQGPHGDWDETKATYRKDHQIPAYEWITKLAFRSLGGEPRRWKLEGNPYRHPTEQEQGAIVQLEANTDIALSQAGIVTQEEVRARPIWRDRYALPDPQDAAPELGAMPEDIRDPAALPAGEPGQDLAAAEAAPAVEAPKPADMALNGAQIIALNATIKDVAAGAIPRSSGAAIVARAINVSLQEAESMMPPEGFTPTAVSKDVVAAPRTDAKQRTIGALLERLAPTGKCNECGEKHPLEVDHINGRGWDPAELSDQQRADKYWQEYERGTKLRALCRSCNGRDGAKNKQGKSGPAHRGDAISVGEDKAFLFLPLPDDIVRQFSEVQAQVAPPNATLQEIDHVTLVYCPKNGPIPEGRISAGVASLASAAAPFSPIAAKVQGWAYFDGAAKDGQPATALVALLDAPGIDEVHVVLKAALKASGFAPSDAHSFTPHFTICYLPPGERLDDLPAVTGEFTVDRVCFANRKIYELPLIGAQAIDATRDDARTADEAADVVEKLRAYQYRALLGEDREALVASLELVMDVPCEMAERLIPAGPVPGWTPPDEPGDLDDDDDDDEEEDEDEDDDDDEDFDDDDDLGEEDDDDEETREDDDRSDCANPLRQEEGGLFAGCAPGDGPSAGQSTKAAKGSTKEKSAPAKKLTPKQRAAAKAKAVKLKAKEKARKQVERAKAKIAKIKAKEKAAKLKAKEKIKAVKAKAKAKIAAAKEKAAAKSAEKKTVKEKTKQQAAKEPTKVQQTAPAPAPAPAPVPAPKPPAPAPTPATTPKTAEQSAGKPAEENKREPTESTGGPRKIDATSMAARRADHAASRTPEQSQAEMSYSGSVAFALNSKFRKDDPPAASDNLGKTAKNLDASIASAKPLEQDSLLYRGVDPSGARHMLDLKPGDVYQDKGYVSTTASGDYLKQANVEMHIVITARAGTRAAPIASKHPHEDEMLLGRGSRFRVEKVETGLTQQVQYKDLDGVESLIDKPLTLLHVTLLGDDE